MEILVRLAGIQLGPYSENQVRRYLAEGLLSPTDPAKYEGMENWVAVSAVLASMPATPPTPPPKETQSLSRTKTGSLPALKTGPVPKAAETKVAPASPETKHVLPASKETRHIPPALKETNYIPSALKETKNIPSASREAKRETISFLSKDFPLLTDLPAVMPPSGPAQDEAPATAQPAPTFVPPKPQETKRLKSIFPPASSPVEKAPVEKSAPSPSAGISSTNPMAPQLSRSPRAPGKSSLPSLIRALSQNTTTAPLSHVAPPPVAPDAPAPAAKPLPSSVATRALLQKPKETGKSALPSVVKALGQGNAPAIPSESAVAPLPAPMAPAEQPPPAQTVRSDAGSSAYSTRELRAITKRLGRKSLESLVAPAVAPTHDAPAPAVEPAGEARESAPETADAPAAEAEEEVSPPARPRRMPWGVIWICFVLALLVSLICAYVWLPYHAADLLLKALDDGNAAQLESTVDFPSVQASLKDQMKAQIAKSGIQNNNSPGGPVSDAVVSMIDRSIDLYVTSDGISALVNKSDKFAEPGKDLTISPDAAGKILRGLNPQSVKIQGFVSLNDFVIENDAVRLHLQLYQRGWKLNRIEMKSDLQLPSAPSSPSSSTGSVSPMASPVIETYLADGKANYEKGDWKGAIADYSQVLAIDPKAIIAYCNRGFARQAAADQDGAISDFTQALEIDPKLAPAYFGRGKAKMVQGDPDGAIADYTQALGYDPKLVEAYFLRGDVKTTKSDWDGAIADYTQAISLDPTQPGPYNNRGYARQAKNDMEGAIADYTQALSIDPKIPNGYYNRGLAQEAQGNYDAAILDLDQAIDIDPKRPGAYYNRANAKSAKHDVDGAIADYTQALVLDPKLAPAYCNRGLARQAKGDLDGAVDDYTQALAIDPKIAIAYYNRGLIKQQRNDLDGAIADSSRALDLDAKNAQAYYNRGLAKLTKGNLEGAVSDLQQFCTLAPGDHFADHAHLYLWLIAKAQNTKADPDQELSDALQNSWNSAPEEMPTKIAEFLLDRTTETDLIAAASSPDAAKDQGQHCEIWYFAGMKRLLASDKPTAIDYFHRCLATGQKDYCEFILAQAELQALEPPPTPKK